jgi:hypothetical protein
MMEGRWIKKGGCLCRVGPNRVDISEFGFPAFADLREPEPS